MNELVYVLVREDTNVDSGCFETEVIGVYDSFDKAEESMVEEMRNARIDFANDDFEEENYAQGDMSWSIWEKDGFSVNHTIIKIVAKEIN